MNASISYSLKYDIIEKTYVGFQATTLILLFNSCKIKEHVSCFSGDKPLIPSISSSSSPIPLLLPLFPFPFPFRFFFLFNCLQSMSLAASVAFLIYDNRNFVHILIILKYTFTYKWNIKQYFTLVLFFDCLSYSKAS